MKIYDNAVTFLTDYRADADIVFLDIEMPMLDGMSAAEKLRETDPYVIIVFVTNMKQYAIRGYSVGALDFIVKPVSYAALSSLMNKARKLISSRGGSEITVGSGSAVRRVPLSRILYVEVSRHRLTITPRTEISRHGATSATSRPNCPIPFRAAIPATSSASDT